MLLLCVAGAAGVPPPAGSSAGVLSASGDNAASNDAAPARYLFLHIPKTGGSSFVDDAAEHALVSCGHLHCVHVDERQKKWEGDGLPQLAASPRDCNLVACEGEDLQLRQRPRRLFASSGGCRRRTASAVPSEAGGACRAYGVIVPVRVHVWRLHG